MQSADKAELLCTSSKSLKNTTKKKKCFELKEIFSHSTKLTVENPICLIFV